jgi:hypothetical protein
LVTWKLKSKCIESVLETLLVVVKKEEREPRANVQCVSLYGDRCDDEVFWRVEGGGSLSRNSLARILVKHAKQEAVSGVRGSDSVTPGLVTSGSRG